MRGGFFLFTLHTTCDSNFKFKSVSHHPHTDHGQWPSCLQQVLPSHRGMRKLPAPSFGGFLQLPWVLADQKLPRLPSLGAAAAAGGSWRKLPGALPAYQLAAVARQLGEAPVALPLHLYYSSSSLRHLSLAALGLDLCMVGKGGEGGGRGRIKRMWGCQDTWPGIHRPSTLTLGGSRGGGVQLLSLNRSCCSSGSNGSGSVLRGSAGSSFSNARRFESHGPPPVTDLITRTWG